MRDALLPHGFKTVDELGKKFLDHDRNAGANRVVLPGENAAAEERRAFFDAIGVPKDGAGYVLEVDGVKPDPGMEKFAREAFLEVGIPAKEATKLVGRWNKHVGEALKAANDAKAERDGREDQELAKENGANHAAFMDLSNRAAEHMGLKPEQVQSLKDALGPKAAMKFLHRTAQALASEGEQPGAGNGDRGGSVFNIATPDQAKAELARMDADKSVRDTLLDASKPGHQDVKEKRQRLIRIRDGLVDPGARR